MTGVTNSARSGVTDETHARRVTPDLTSDPDRLQCRSRIVLTSLTHHRGTFVGQLAPGFH